VSGRFLQVAASALGVGLLLFGVLFVAASHKQTQAQALLRAISELKLGVSTFTDAQRLTERYGGKPWNGPSTRASCSSRNCYLRFVFQNKPLSYMPCVPGVEFVVGLAVKDGYVVSREVDYSIFTTSRYEFMYLMDDDLKSTEAQGYEVKNLKVDAQGTPHVVRVNLGPLATSEQSGRAYSLDLSCLAKLGGCRTPASIFPRGL